MKRVSARQCPHWTSAKYGWRLHTTHTTHTHTTHTTNSTPPERERAFFVWDSAAENKTLAPCSTNMRTVVRHPPSTARCNADCLELHRTFLSDKREQRGTARRSWLAGGKTVGAMP